MTTSNTNTGPLKTEAQSTLTTSSKPDNSSAETANQQNHQTNSNQKQGTIEEGQDQKNGNPQVSEEFSDCSDYNNPQSERISSQEINNEIDLKKNRNRLITTLLIGCAIAPLVFLGLITFGVVDISSLMFFKGYGASEVVLGLIATSAVSQVSLSLVSRSGIEKIDNKKSRVFDGINPSVAQDVRNQELEKQQQQKKAEQSQAKASESMQKKPSWQQNLNSARSKRKNTDMQR